MGRDQEVWVPEGPSVGILQVGAAGLQVSGRLRRPARLMQPSATRAGEACRGSAIEAWQASGWRGQLLGPTGRRPRESGGRASAALRPQSGERDALVEAGRLQHAEGGGGTGASPLLLGCRRSRPGRSVPGVQLPLCRPAHQIFNGTV